MTRCSGLPCVVVAILLFCLFPSFSAAQGLEAYAAGHLFGLGGATPNRQFGLGGTIASVHDYGFANPAFAAAQTDSHSSLRGVFTDFDCGLKLQGFQAHYVVPLQAGRKGLQVTVYDLDSRAGTILTAGGPAQVGLEQRDVGLHYGQRLGERWLAGVGIAPYGRGELNLTAPGGMPLLQVHSKADLGARLGVAYELGPDSYAGLVYDHYRDKVSASGLAVGAPVQGKSKLKLLAAGVSQRVRENLLLVAEYQWTEVRVMGAKSSQSGWHGGAELMLNPQWRLRSGVSDGFITAGLGCEREQWSFDYAYVGNWNAESVRALLGSSDTHMFSAVYRW
jgi:hypothetical protein